MARRSPMNERYQKNTAPAGKTRKSAAAAKPKRASGASSSASKKSKPSAGASRGPLVVNPDTPEYRFWRRMWWVLLGSAMAVVLVSLLFMRNPAATPYLRYALVVSYGLMGAALFVDIVKLRRMRKAWIATGGHPEILKTDKPAEESPTTAEKPDDKGSSEADKS